MKKLVLTVAIVLSMTAGAMAQGGGLFQKGNSAYNNGGTRENHPMLPGSYTGTEDVNAEGTPLADGVLILAGLGAAYLIGKKKKD